MKPFRLHFRLPAVLLFFLMLIIALGMFGVRRLTISTP
jgi:hypothetical protein